MLSHLCSLLSGKPLFPYLLQSLWLISAVVHLQSLKPFHCKLPFLVQIERGEAILTLLWRYCGCRRKSEPLPSNAEDSCLHRHAIYIQQNKTETDLTRYLLTRSRELLTVMTVEKELRMCVLSGSLPPKSGCNILEVDAKSTSSRSVNTSILTDTPKSTILKFHRLKAVASNIEKCNIYLYL